MLFYEYESKKENQKEEKKIADPFDLPSQNISAKAQAEQLLRRQLSGRRIDLGQRSQEVRTEFRKLLSIPANRRAVGRVAEAKERAKELGFSSLQEAQQLSGFAKASPRNQSIAPPNQTFADVADVQVQQQPTNVIKKAPTRREQFKQFIQDRNPITGTIAFASEKTQGFISQREVKGDFGFAKGGQSLATTGLISTTGQTAPYFVPYIGQGLLLTSSAAQFTPSGMREAKNIGSSIEGSTGIPSSIATTGVLGVSGGLGLIGGVGVTRQLSKAAGLPKSQVSITGVSTNIKQSTKPAQTIFLGKEGSSTFNRNIIPNIKTESGALDIQLTPKNIKQGKGFQTIFKPKREVFVVESEADALVTTKTNLFLPSSTQKVKAGSKTIIEKPIGENIFTTKTSFRGTSEQTNPLVSLPTGKSSTLFGKSKDFEGLSFGSGFDIEARGQLALAKPSRFAVVEGKTQGFSLKEVSQVSQIEREGKLNFLTGRLKTTSFQGDPDFFGSTTTALGNKKEVGFVSFSNKLLPKLEDGFTVSKSGGFKSEGVFKLKKPSENKEIFNIGRELKQVKKTGTNFADILGSVEKERVSSIVKQSTPTKTPPTLKGVGRLSSPSQTGRELYRGVPVSEFQGVQSNSLQQNNFQPLAFGLPSSELFKQTASQVNLLKPAEKEKSIFRQSGVLTPAIKQATNQRQGLGTKQVLKTKQTQRGRPFTKTGFGIGSPTFFIPRVFGFGLPSGLSRGRRGKSSLGFSLPVGRLPSLDALGLNITGRRRARGEFIGAGSLVTRPILTGGRRGRKKKKKRRS